MAQKTVNCNGIKISNGEFKHHVFESNEIVELSNY